MRKREIRSKRGAADMFSPFGDNVRGPLLTWSAEQNRLALAAFRGEVSYTEATAQTGRSKKQLKGQAAHLVRLEQPGIEERRAAAALPF